MKRNLFYIWILCICCAFAACSEEDSPVYDSTLRIISVENINFQPDGGWGSITVEAVGTLEASSDKEWCTFNIEGNTVNVHAEHFTGMSSRTAAITINADGKSVTVPVVQEGLVMRTDEYDLYHWFDYSGGSFSYSFKANCTYDVSLSADAASWVSYEMDEENHLLNVTVKPNASSTPRGAVISIFTSTKEVKLQISQVEVAEEMIADVWNCAYSSMGLAGDDGVPVPVAADVPIQKTSTEHLYVLPALTLQDVYLPLVFENGLLKIAAGQNVGTIQGFNLVTLYSSEGGALFLEGDIVGLPMYENGKVVYKFGRSRAASGGSAVADLILGAFQGSTFAGWVEQVLNLSLSKDL